MKFLIKFILLFFIILLLNSHDCSALTLLEDNFNDGSATDGNPVFWEQYFGNLGSWTVENGEYVGYVYKTSSNDIPTYAIAGNDSWDNYRFTVRIKNDAGIDKIILFRYHSLNETYAIKLISSWPVYGNKITMLKNNLIPWWGANADYANSIGTWYTMSVEVNANNIKVFIDNSTTPILNYTDLDNPILNGKIGLLTWPGGYGGGNTQVRFDDVLVTTLDPEPTATPSPSPSPTSTPTPTNTPTLTPSPTPTLTPTLTPTPISSTINPVVILPGLGASWNADALLNCKIYDYSGEWTLAPYAIDAYKSLISNLGNYAKPFYYDWRKDVRSQAYPLKDFINSLGNAKVNMVGHSLGGLVARAYLELEKENSQLDKLLTVGSPHQGSPVAYAAWAGGDVWEDSLINRIGITILLKRCGGHLMNNRETIQRVIPSIQNLLPTFPYLKDKKADDLKPLAGMNIHNNWLPTSFPPSFFGVTMGTLSGNGFNTIESLPVKEPNKIDESLGNWVDGKPAGKEWTREGDGRALLSSTQIPGADNQVIKQNHGGLVTSAEGIGKILDFFGLGTTSFETSNLQESKSALVIIGYPANFWVMDQNGQIIKDNDGIVSLTNPKDNKYKFGLLPKNGQSLFIVGQFLENGRTLWKEYNFDGVLLKLGQINFNPVNPQEDPLQSFF